MKFHACRVEFLTTGEGRARLSENFDVTKDERSRKVNSATASVKFHTRLWNFYDKRGGEGKGGGEGGKEREKGFQDYWRYVVRNVGEILRKWYYLY